MFTLCQLSKIFINFVGCYLFRNLMPNTCLTKFLALSWLCMSPPSYLLNPSFSFIFWKKYGWVKHSPCVMRPVPLKSHLMKQAKYSEYQINNLTPHTNTKTNTTSTEHTCLILATSLSLLRIVFLHATAPRKP